MPRALLLLPLLAAQAAAAAVKPSCVFILVDDLGHNDVAYNNRSADGTTAGRLIQSPNIDEMADTGIKLLNYYVQPICTPTRSALMTGRYAFRWGATGYTIGSPDPWGVPLDEVFFPELLQQRGWTTAVFGKWHMGMFKKEYLPTSRGFNYSTGMLSGASDHYSHITDGAYDWHHMETPNFDVDGRYAGNLVRDDALAFFERVSGGGGGTDGQQQQQQQEEPFFLYLPFQECHSPFQVDANYSALYPHLPAGPRRTLPGMVTHTDEMIGDVVRALKQHKRWDDTLVIFSAGTRAPSCGSCCLLPAG